VDLNSRVGAEFEIQGMRFAGVEQCKPCYWMNSALGSGAEDWLQGSGGLRARILTDGILQHTTHPPHVCGQPDLWKSADAR
jgi:hypothetical protein